MALYISTAQRRCKAAVIGAVALVIGLAAGFGLARVTTTSVEDKVASVQKQVRDTTGGLRVLALHAQASVGGTSDVQPVLARTRDGLNAEFASAPWIGVSTRESLLAELAALEAMSPTSATFGPVLSKTADHIDQAFGISGGR